MSQPTASSPLTPQPWYRGLTRYHWWVLVIAAMGWMFDTMDQQFFNLGRQSAMTQVVGYDPIRPALEKLGDIPRRLTVAQLEELRQRSAINSEQFERLKALAGDGGVLTRKQVAELVGQDLLAPKYIELGEQHLQDQGVQEAVFDRARLDALVDGKIISNELADQFRDRLAGSGVERATIAQQIGQEEAKVCISAAGNQATKIFIIGWAIGGLFFGWIGDSLGRAKTMAVTILVYAIFTGLSGLARTEFEFNLLRFLTALGIGGEFAAGAALVAETMPDRSRPAALGMLQALSAVGNCMGAVLAYFILPDLGWRWLFLVGALPGLIAVLIFLRLQEPEKWKASRAMQKENRAKGVALRSSYAGLFSEWRWTKRAIVGLLLGVVGVGGLWGVAFFSPELTRSIGQQLQLSHEAKDQFAATTFFLQQVGAFFGISAYTWLALKWGRKPAFAVFFAFSFVVLAYTFLRANTMMDAYILLPLVGFTTLGPFGGYAIYFPELFPTRLRATGTGFCYNVGRFLAAFVPQFKNGLMGLFMSGTLALPWLASAAGNSDLAIRYASFMMVFIYLLGLIVLLFAPETHGQPLPDDGVGEQSSPQSAMAASGQPDVCR